MTRTRRQLRTPVIDVKKYGGKEVALMDGRIVASGRSTHAVLKRAQRTVSRTKHDQIWLFRVPRSLTVIYQIP